MWPFRAAPIVKGVVIDKHHYTEEEVHSVMLTKQNAGFYQGLQDLALSHIPTSDGWSLIVKGTTAKGKLVTREIYVSAAEWGSIQIGFPWYGGSGGP